MFEYEYELETGWNGESECEFSSEYESDQFLPLLAPVLASAAPAAIRAIGGLFRRRRRRRRAQRELELETPMGEYESEYESEYEGDPFIGNLLQGLGSALGMAEGELEFEDEFEFETTPQSSEYEVMMEHLAYQASQTESEAEAEAFLGALIPLATRLIPMAAKAATSVAPSLIRGIASVGQTLHRNPATRQLLRTMPTVLKGTVRTVAQHAAQGKPLSSSTALRALAKNTANVLGSPRRAQRAMRGCHQAQHRARAMTNVRKRRPALV